MLPRGLKTNIGVNIIILLLVAMILIDFVMMIFIQRSLIRTESSKGHFLIATIKKQLLQGMDTGDIQLNGNFLSLNNNILMEAGVDCALVMNKHQQQVYFKGAACVLHDELIASTRRSINTGDKVTQYFGTTWGVFWKQNQNLLLAAPISFQRQIVGGIGLVLPLEGIYQTLRNIQKFLFVYIFINTIILATLGIYRLSKFILEPIRRLVHRAEDYKEDDGIFFSVRKEDNELHQLSNALNRMLLRISEDKEKLRSTVMSLEKANFELKQAQREIIQAEKLASVGRLSSGIAHEIGNPIGIILGYFELLKQKDLPTHEKQEFIRRAEDEINRINLIIRQLLDYSRPADEGSKPVSVHAILSDVLNVIKLQPLIANLNIDLKLSAEQDTVLAEPNQLRQVFMNLIINSADALAAQTNNQVGHLEIETGLSANQESNAHNTETLQLLFSDNGPGIASAHLGNVFDPFFSTKEPGKGTGLGLYVSFMIVEGLGGRLEAISTEGHGTTMKILLPIHNSMNTD